MINKINTLTVSKNINGIINPKKLGYICPDGTINFQTTNAAIEYSKNKIVAGLKSSKPHNTVIVRENNRIMEEKNGIKSIFSRKYDTNATVISGNADTYAKGCTTPVTADCFDMLIKTNNIDEVIVYNSLGEYSKLEKISKPHHLIFNSMLTHIQEKIFHSKYNKMINSLMPKDSLMKETVAKFEIKHGSENDTFREELKAEVKEVANLRNNIPKTEKGAKAIHEFWVKNASKYGLEYSTNYSSLK